MSISSLQRINYFNIIKMSEAMDNSSPSLWGEIKSEACSEGIESVWKPIHEYQNVDKHKRNISHQCDCFEEEEHFCYDPVGQHLILLRKCHSELSTLLLKTEEGNSKKMQNAKNEGTSQKSKCKKRKLPLSSIPEFSENCSLKDSFQVFSKNKSKSKITCRRCSPDIHAKEQITHFVKRVLAQIGYNVDDLKSDTSAIKCLANITDKFLTEFISRMRYHKNSGVYSENQEQWGPLETTLQEIQFNGIHGLHQFYSEKVVKKRDILLRQCKDMLVKYEKLNS